MGAHYRPDSDFDEESESYPDLRTPRVAYRQGVLTGAIVTWGLLLAAAVVYLALVR